ncbi:hypothetical protein MEO41_12245 [Dolichospermum sp. ST_sed4]|nr:hypothetical protein [Dolichospermum sp. ST_sed4]
MKSIDPSLTTGLKMIPSINSDQITAITTGSDGAIYVSGYTYRNLDGQTNNGNWDAFITKYLPDGTKSWTNLLGGSEHDQFTSLTTDSDGAIYVSGYTYGDIDGQTNNGGADAFITKYLPDGTKSWTNLFEGSDYNIAAGMTTGGDCATYPSYIDSNLDEETNNGIDDGSNGIDDGSNGIDDGLNGIDDGLNGIDDGLNGIDDCLNGIDDGLNGIDDGLITIDNSLNGIDDGLNGIDDGLITIDDGLITIDDGLITIDDGLIPKPWECGTITNDDGLITIDDGLITIDDGLIPKQWECGTIEWTYLFGGRRDDFTNAITTGSDGAIYISGYSYGDLNVNGQTYSGGYYDAFITKYLPDGTKAWTNVLGGGSDYDQITSMKTGSDGAIYVSGYTYGDMDGQTYNGNGDAFITKYLPDGTKSWTNLLGGSDYDQNTDIQIAICFDYPLYSMDGQTYNGGDAFITKLSVNNIIPTITLAVSPSSVLENGTTNLVYTFTRTGDTTNALNVNYNVGGTATFNTDYIQTGAASYTNTTGAINFAAGATTATLTINPTADTTVESDETVALTLATGTGYTIGTTTPISGTITNDDTSVTLAVSPSNVTEDGTTNLVYTFTRTGVTTNALTVNYNVSGTATFNNDYTQIGAASHTATKGTITFAAGATTATLAIDPTADTTVENNETVALTLATGTGYTIGTTTAVTGTITNDDLPSINLSPNQTVVEGNTSPQSVTYTVTLSNPSTQSITVKYATANGTATSGLDYTSKSGTLTFAPGVTNQSLNIPILNNNLNEADETFSLQLTAPTNAVLGANSTVSTTITDTLTASVTTTLPTNVENLTLTGTGAIKATGNAGNNIITGNSANNTLAGLNGNDTYFFVAKTALGTDTIIETTTGGIDTLGFTGTTTAINVNLGVSTLQRVNSNLKLILSANNVIENATGGTGNDRITGNILNNTLNGGDGNDQLQGLEGNDSLWGGAGNDILSGGSGDDSLWGGASNDILMGGVGNDKYLFQSSSVFATSLGIDYISEFEAGLDQIVLSKTTFNAITNTVGQALTDFAVVTDDEFVNASNAHIVFSQGTGSLFYNQDANLLGANTVFEFARLGNPDITLSSSNFSLVV